MYIFSDVIDLPCNFDYGEIHIIYFIYSGFARTEKWQNDKMACLF